jgi:hypothetical protein
LRLIFGIISGVVGCVLFVFTSDAIVGIALLLVASFVIVATGFSLRKHLSSGPRG